jgi:hypothetical protein
MDVPMSSCYASFRLLVSASLAIAVVACMDAIDPVAPAGAPSAASVQPGTIGDRVWSDTDADGIQDAGEPGIAGIPVFLRHDGRTIATATSDAGGSYEFADLAPGCYGVLAVPPGGMVPSLTGEGDATTDSNANPGPVCLTPLQPEDRTIDFGFFPKPSALVTVSSEYNNQTGQIEAFPAVAFLDSSGAVFGLRYMTQADDLGNAIDIGWALTMNSRGELWTTSPAGRLLQIDPLTRKVLRSVPQSTESPVTLVFNVIAFAPGDRLWGLGGGDNYLYEITIDDIGYTGTKRAPMCFGQIVNGRCDINASPGLTGMAFAADGTLYGNAIPVERNERGVPIPYYRLVKIDVDTGDWTAIAEQEQSTLGLTVDANGHLVATSYTTRSVLKYDALGRLLQTRPYASPRPLNGIVFPCSVPRNCGPS